MGGRRSSTYTGLGVARGHHVQPVDGHEGDLPGQAQAVHFCQNHGARPVCVHDVVKQPAKEE